MFRCTAARLLAIVLFTLSSIAYGVTFSNQRVSTTNPAASSGCVPPPSMTSFLTTDAAVYLYFEATTTLSDQITSDWLAPDGAALTGGDWNLASGNYCYTSASLGISSSTPENRLGLWHARVYANGTLLFAVPFTISAPGTGPYGQVITTVAGGGWRAFPTSDIPAISAPLGTPFGVALDGQGNVYVADSSNNNVVRISPSGTLTVVAGNSNPGFSGDGGPLPALHSTDLKALL